MLGICDIVFWTLPRKSGMVPCPNLWTVIPRGVPLGRDVPRSAIPRIHLVTKDGRQQASLFYLRVDTLDVMLCLPTGK